MWQCYWEHDGPGGPHEAPEPGEGLGSNPLEYYCHLDLQSVISSSNDDYDLLTPALPPVPKLSFHPILIPHRRHSDVTDGLYVPRRKFVHRR